MSGDELSADDAWSTLRRAGVKAVGRDAFIRFRYADGFSHARALALQVCLSVIPAVIAFVGLSAMLHHEGGGQALEGILERVTPGASRKIVRAALETGRARAQDDSLALWLGLAAALVSMATAMGQIERGANRIYGVERDRPSLRKYGNASLLVLISGLPMAAGMIVTVAGGAVGDSLGQVYHWSAGEHTAWQVARWPVGVLLALTSASAIFRRAPRRRQPSRSWLAVGAAVSLALWAGLSALLGWYVGDGGGIGATYGPLTAVIALMVWANLTSIALFLGLAAAAQLEACRTSTRAPVRPDPGT
ncbi:YihY/virulence factor BrkB family protein [Actinocrinis puniceicyclus]|uniref:YihY/virulence factor BrkB family protein n=2 Tax=Actinocrinis puniceicyclus TaxID=977794 RepID=A0A8J7WNV5_9ACTN|nr:YihY/virulence factor BrkB family protein [Actinocrinis puniceicyclus]